MTCFALSAPSKFKTFEGKCTAIFLIFKNDPWDITKLNALNSGRLLKKRHANFECKTAHTKYKIAILGQYHFLDFSLTFSLVIFRLKTLPEAQRTQGIESLALIMFLTEST